MPSTEPLQILIIAGDYYKHIIDELIAGTAEALEASGAEHALVRVPGALEIPAVIAAAERAGHRATGRAYDGYVALGAVIRGETTHYEIVANESARAIMGMTLEGLAIGNGILTTENEAQAVHRASRTGKNKGREAAVACLNFIEVRKRLNMGGV